MTIRTDFHLHTTISVDAEAKLDDLLSQAVSIGMTEVAITDHLDANPADEGMGCYDAQKAFDATQQARAKFDGKLFVRHGVELGEPHLYKANEYKAIYELPMDVIIGSVHYVENHGVHGDLFDIREREAAISDYFELMQQMVEQGDFDILGHLDYFDRYTS